jgi:signal transduction histidine kinase
VLAGLVLGIGTLQLTRESPSSSLAERSAVGGAVLLGAGWLAIGLGLRAWQRHPGRRYGPLLIAAGFAWFLAEWNNPGTGSAAVFTAGVVLYAACPPLVAHAALTYPGGRLASRVEAAALGVAYTGALIVLGLLPAVFFEPADQSCAFCPANLVAVASHAGVVSWFNHAGLRLGVASLLTLAALAAWRLRCSTSAARRAKAPVLVPVIAYLGLVAASYTYTVSRGTLSIDRRERSLWLAQGVALVAVSLGVAWGWVRARRTRSAVADLVVELGESPGPGGLRDALATALYDAKLAVAYPVEDGRHVDAAGRDVELPTTDERVITPLVREDRLVALLIHRADLLDDPVLVEETVSSARLAIDNERLQAVARAQLSDLQASRARIVEAGDHERRRLERDLHDGAQQRLVALSLALRLTRSRLGSDSVSPVATHLDQAAAELHNALMDLRHLADGIHPAVLSDEGLAAALESLAEGTSMPLQVTAVPEQRLPAPIEAAAYQLVAEAVQAGPARVNATCGDGMLVVDVEAARRLDHLVELEDRVGALDGHLTVETVSGDTVRIRAEIPCG